MFVQTRAGNIRLAWLEGVSLSVIKADVGMDEWREMLTLTRAGGDRGTTVSVVVLGNVNITAEQRQATAEMQKEMRAAPLRAMAMVTESQLARGALTAYSWLAPGPTKYKAFATAAPALNWVKEVQPFDLATVAATLQAMRD